MLTSEQRRAFILNETKVAVPPLGGGLRLHLITEQCRLWRADAQMLKELQVEEPFWGFAWPGGQAIAQILARQPELVSQKTVLSFGSGGGIEALAAVRAGAARVVAADIDPFAIEAARLNADLNQLSLELQCSNLIDQDHGWDVVLCGDVTYSESLSGPVQKWLLALVQRGATVVLAEPRRGFLAPMFRGEAEPEGFKVERASVRTPADVDPGGALQWDTAVVVLRRCSPADIDS